MATETELKYRVGDLQLLDCILCDSSIRAAMREPFSYIKMQTTYYDTEDELLASNRQMLRLRTENDTSVVCFKTPAENGVRGEWECESAYLDEALETLIKKGAPDVLKTVKADALLPVCGAEFTRIFARLCPEDGLVIEVCGDIGTLTGNGHRQELCELELELKEGTIAQLQAFGNTLSERYHLKTEPKSKQERARALSRKK